MYVTHDQQEALILSDFIAVMKDGEVLQTGQYHEIYRTPSQLFIAGFLNPDTMTPAINTIPASAMFPDRTELVVGIRPEDLTVSTVRTQRSFAAKVLQSREMAFGKGFVLECLAGDREVVAQMKDDPAVSAGQEVFLTAKRCHLFDKQSGKRLETIE